MDVAGQEAVLQPHQLLERLTKGEPASSERYEFTPKGGVRWPDVDKPRIGAMNTDRLRSLLGQLDGTAKQIERQENPHCNAEELSEAAGSQRTRRFSFQPAVGVPMR